MIQVQLIYNDDCGNTCRVGSWCTDSTRDKLLAHASHRDCFGHWRNRIEISKAQMQLRSTGA